MAADPTRPRPEKALLLAADSAPDEAAIRGATTAAERVRRVVEFYDPLDASLREALAPLQIEIERQDVLGSWTVRGSSAALQRLHDPDGPLGGLAVHIVEDDTFFALHRPG
jgi:hypothetical protein